MAASAKTERIKQNLLVSAGIEVSITSILFTVQRIEELASASANEERLPSHDSPITNTEELERFLHFRELKP